MFTLRQLANRTLSTLKAHPVLAIPVLVADLIGFAAMHLQHALHQPLFELFLDSNRSVLATTHTAFVLTPENATKAALLTAPLLWGCYFLNIVLYTSALLTIATLLNGERTGEIRDLRRIRSVLMSSKRRILRFSGLTLLSLIVQLPLGYLTFLIGDKAALLTPLNGRNLGYALAFTAELLSVLLLSRPVLSLLRSPEPDKMNRHLVSMVGIAALIAQFALLLGIEHLPPSFFHQKTVLGLLCREAFTSMLCALPYVPLFISISIIDQDSQERILEEPLP